VQLSFVFVQLSTFGFCINITLLWPWVVTGFVVTLLAGGFILTLAGYSGFKRASLWKKKSRFSLTRIANHNSRTVRWSRDLYIALFWYILRHDIAIPNTKTLCNYFWREKLINRYPTADEPIASQPTLIRSCVAAATGAAQRRMNRNQVTIARAESDMTVAVNRSSAISQHLPNPS